MLYEFRTKCWKLLLNPESKVAKMKLNPLVKVVNYNNLQFGHSSGQFAHRTAGSWCVTWVLNWLKKMILSRNIMVN